jgi:hypothetical protein
VLWSGGAGSRSQQSGPGTTDRRVADAIRSYQKAATEAERASGTVRLSQEMRRRRRPRGWGDPRSQRPAGRLGAGADLSFPPPGLPSLTRLRLRPAHLDPRQAAQGPGPGVEAQGQGKTAIGQARQPIYGQDLRRPVTGPGWRLVPENDHPLITASYALACNPLVICGRRVPLLPDNMLHVIPPRSESSSDGLVACHSSLFKT